MTLTLQDVKTVEALVRDAAAQEIMPRFGRLAAQDIASKSSADDLVTIADIRTEERLSAALRAAFPQAVVCGEESGSDTGGDAGDDASGGGPIDPEAHHLLFVIDPVDGTWPFARGMPIFGSMVAVFEGGQAVAGVIHYPLTGESLICRKGQGVQLLDAQGQSCALPPLRQGQGIAAGTISQRRDGVAPLRLDDVARVMAIYCSAWEYRLLLSGAVDFLINHGPLNLWDHAAGQVMVAELGGACATLSGLPWAQIGGDDLLVTGRSDAVLGQVLDQIRQP